MSKKSMMTVLTVVMTVALVFGMSLPANAAQAGALAFNALATLPDFPCAGAACQVTSLSGPAFGAIVGTGPNGATACTTGAGACDISEGPAGITYDEPPCVAGEPLQGSANGQAQISGGQTLAGASQTPLVLNLTYIRVGVVAVITFTGGGQVGAAAGIFVPVAGADCVSGNGPATVRVIGAGAAVDN